MAAEKNITSRIQQKHDTAANWANATTFIPKKGEIVIYDAEYNTSGVQTQAVRFKIGDGSRTINNLPFALIDYDNRITSLENTVDGLGTAAQKDVGFFATAAQGTKADNAVPNTRKVNNKALSTDIKLEPSDVGVTESAFPGLKKTGTITGIKMNGASKGTSGVVDLGTVLTSHQSIRTLNTDNNTSQTVSASESISGTGTINLHKVAKTGSYNDLLNKPTIPTDTGATSVEVTGTGNAVTAASYNATNRKLTLTKGSTFLTSHQDISGKLDKTTYEWNKEFRASSNGAISLGRYNIYDTQLTFDISSTTSASMNGKLVIAAQNGRIVQAKVFGDATGALVSKIVIYQSAIVNNRSWVEVFCNFDGWSKNKVHIYGVALDSATVTNQMSSVTFTNGVPSPITSGDSKWNGTIDNDLSKKQDKLTAGSNITISGNTISANAYVLPSANSDRLGGIKISFSNGVLTITT